MDFERAAKLSGARFVVLQGQLARLERALGAVHARPAHDASTATPRSRRRCWCATRRCSAPASCRSSTRTCSTPTNGFWLIPTAEVPLTNLVRDADPRREASCRCASPPARRASAPRPGAAGKDTRGMIRQHQFDKVELVSITTPEQSRRRARAHDRLRRGGAEAARTCRIRIMMLCTGDMGFARAQDLRHRGLAAGPGRLSRDLVAARTAATSRRGA